MRLRRSSSACRSDATVKKICRPSYCNLRISRTNGKLPDLNAIREFYFPDPRSKFPVPITREFCEKAHYSCVLFNAARRRNGLKSAKFPVFSLLIKEFAVESRSQ